MSNYKENSLISLGAIGLGTGVMISAGIFALLGQVAELAGMWFPFIFIVGGIVTGFSAYSYVKMSNEFPSAGGIGIRCVNRFSITVDGHINGHKSKFSCENNRNIYVADFSN